MNRLGLWLFAGGLVLSWANSALHVALPDRPLYAMSARMFKGRVSTLRLVTLGLASVGFVGLIALFLKQASPEWVALVILLVLLGIRRLEIIQWPDNIVVKLGKYVPSAACLLAWLIASVTLRWTGKPVEDARALGWQAACGVMAGAYVLAAIAKLRQSGFSWAHPRYQALLVAERAFAGPRWLRAVRLQAARSKAASTVIGFVGLFAEFLAVLFIVPAARPWVIALVIALHLGFILLLGYFEIEWILVLVAVATLAG